MSAEFRGMGLTQVALQGEVHLRMPPGRAADLEFSFRLEGAKGIRVRGGGVCRFSLKAIKFRLDPVTCVDLR